MMVDFNAWIVSHGLNFIAGMACGIPIGVWLVMKRINIGCTKKEKSIPTREINDYGDENFKLVLIVRTDLKMGKGKVAAQCCHAAVMAYQQAEQYHPDILAEWEESGQAKVVLKVESEEELLDLARSARNQGLVTSLVRDAGRTQIASGSKTVLGIGPAPVKLVDMVSGHLRLF